MAKIGLVGAGSMGAVHHTSYQHINGAAVVALVGSSAQDVRSAKEWNLPLYASIPEMLAQQDVDIVDVCTPTFLHFQHVNQALEGGKSVICEKPLALTGAQARQMYDLAGKAGLHIYVAQVVQFYKQTQVLRSKIESGEYGKPLDAYFTRLSACPKWAQNGWLFHKEQSGLVPFDLHIHDLDLLISLFGVPKTSGYTAVGGAGKPYKEHYRFSYGYPNFNAVAEAGWLNADIPFISGWRVYFENGMLINEDGVVTGYPSEGPPQVFNTMDAAVVSTGAGVPPTGAYIAQLAHFISCWRRGQSSPVVPRTQILAVLDVLEHMLQND